MNNQWNELKTETLFHSPEHSIASPYLARFEYPWQALSGLHDFILEIGKTLPKDEYEQRGESVWISKRATIAPTAAIDGPCVIIGPCIDSSLRFDSRERHHRGRCKRRALYGHQKQRAV